MRRAVLAVLLPVLAGSLSAGDNAWQRSGESLAITGATVVVGNGRVIANGTVVLRDGLVETVGAKIVVPPGVQRFDARGHFVYPGLIDTMTEQGLRQEPTGATTGRQEPADTRSAALLADVRAVDRLDPAATALAAWRDAGVLAFNVAPKSGVFMGQTALVSPNGEAPERTVVRSPTAMRLFMQGLGYRNRRRGQPEPGGIYPTRLIGVVAFIRQTLIDAREYDAAQTAVEKGGQGSPRPPADPKLDALRPVVARTLPLICNAQEEREVRRVTDLAAEMNVRAVVAGGYEAVQLSDTLKALGVPVLVSLNFPRPGTDVPPDFEIPVRVLDFYEHAPKAPAELARAGVRFAFYSDGLETGAEFVRNLRRAVREGLPKDAAVRAATLSAAEILGVDRTLGSIEPGKVANLVIADGDLLDESTRVRSVVVHGKRIEVQSPGGTAAAARGPGGSQMRPVDGSKAAAVPRASALPAPVSAGTPGEILIKNVTVMTVSHGTIEQGAVLVRDGRIAAVGRDLRAGPNAHVIDATGKWITPGLIDAHLHYPTDSHNEATRLSTSMTRIADTLNPTDIIMWRELSGGVTTAHVMHGSVNPIGGQNAVIKMRWGRTVPGILFEGAPKSLKFAVGEYPPGRVGISPPSSVMGMETVYRAWLAKARAYAAEWEDYQRAKAAGAPPLLPPHRDLELEPLVEVLKGERQVHVHSFKAHEMLMLMRVAEDFGFRIRMFHHASGAYQVAEELARHGASASIFADLNVDTLYNAAMLMRKGVLVSVNSDSEETSRYLNQQAAQLMPFGDLTEDEALALVTLNPARQLMIDTRVGSIDVGKDADLVLWTRHPLSVYAVADTVFIDGRIYFSLEKERARAGGPPPVSPTPPEARDAASTARVLGERALPAMIPGAVPNTDGKAASPGRPSPGRDRSPSGPSPASYAIANARILTVSGPPIDVGSVVIRDGRIAGVGAGVNVPSGATRIDATGMTVFPGLFDPNTAIGIAETAREVEMGPANPHLLAFSNFVPASESVRSSRMGGVTHALVRASGGVIPGTGAVVNLAGRTAEEMEIARHGALVITFPTVGDTHYTDDERFQVTPFSSVKAAYERRVADLKRLFAGARDYVARKAKLGPEELRRFVPDDRLEAMIPVVRGEHLVLIEADNQPDIKAAVAFATEERLNYAILGGQEAWKVVGLLAEKGAKVILGPVQAVPAGEDDPVDAVYRMAAVLHERGVPFAFTTGTRRMFDTDPRFLRREAGNAVAHGLPYDAALRAMTLTPAEFFGIADRLGSIEKGKVANLVVADGDPFEYRTRILHVFINGTPVDLASRHSQAYEKYGRRP